MARIKNVLISLITASCFLLPSTVSARTITPEYLDKNKKILERVDYDTFKQNLDSGITKQKIKNQKQFLEDLTQELNTSYAITPEYGFNFNREIGNEEFSRFIFDNVIEERIGYEIKTPTDVIVGINLAIEYLSRYNGKMRLEHKGLGSDINNDRRFDGINWNYLKGIEWSLYKKIIENPEEGIKINKEEYEKIDRVPTDKLLIDKEGSPEAVEWICRNYMSALKILFETAKTKYPEFTKNVELVQMLMPAHVFGAFINKNTSEYIVVDPTNHDTIHNIGIIYPQTIVWPKEKDDIHYDCLQDENYFKILSVEKLLIEYQKKLTEEMKKDPYNPNYEKTYEGSKELLESLLLKVQDLAKKYPNSKQIADLQVKTYSQFLNYFNEESYQKGLELFRGLYAYKGYKEKTNYYSGMLMNMGVFALALEKNEEALKYFKECAKFQVFENEFVDDAMLCIAEVNLYLGNYYEALFRAKDVLDICPEYYENLMKGAKEICSRSAKELWNDNKRDMLHDFIEGNYEEAVKSLEGKENAESKLLLAESHSALNHYDTAKSLYEELAKGNDKDIARLAKNELQQMNRKFFLYGYTHFFDGKNGKAKKELEFLKSKITPEDEIAEKTSLILIYAYAKEGNRLKLFKEGKYFLKTFPESEFLGSVKENLERIAQMGRN